MPIVGSFAGASARAYGAGAGGVQIGDFESIATVALTGTQTNIEFTSIPATYSHLQIRGIARGTSPTESDVNIYCQFNGDTSTSYIYHYLYGNGSSAASGATTTAPEIIIGRVTAATSGANMFGVFILDILDYANTNKFKTTRSLTGHDQNGSGSAWLFSGNWRSTAAITSMKFYFSPGSFAAYSSFALYGVKA